MTSVLKLHVLDVYCECSTCMTAIKEQRTIMIPATRLDDVIDSDSKGETRLIGLHIGWILKFGGGTCKFPNERDAKADIHRSQILCMAPNNLATRLKVTNEVLT